MDEVMTLVTQVVGLAESHAWIPLASVVIGLLTRLVKDDRFVAWFPVTIPPQMRAMFALGLGVVSGVLAGIVGGETWPKALIGGVIAAITAISSHDIVIEGLRGGRELGEPKNNAGGGPGGIIPPPPPEARIKSKQSSGYSMVGLAMGLAMAMAVSGCASVMPLVRNVTSIVQDAQQVIAVVRGGLDIYFVSHPSPETQVKVDSALRKVDMALDVAVRASHGSDSLSQSDADAAFQDFKVAYQELVVLLRDLGIEGNKVGASKDAGLMGARVPLAMAVGK